MKILVVLPRFPYPLEKGDKLRAYHQIRCLSQQNEVYLFCVSHSKVSARQIEALQPYCKEIKVVKLQMWACYKNIVRNWVSSKSLQMGYWDNKHARHKYRQFEAHVKPDVVYNQMVRTMYLVSRSTYPKVMDYQDALSMNTERRMERAHGLQRYVFHYEFKMLRSSEYNAFKIFDALTIISENDSEAIPHKKNGDINIIRNGVDFEYFTPLDLPKTYDVLFCGNMQYPPNVDAARFLVEEIMPLVWKQKPEAKVLLAGATPKHEVRCLASDRVAISGTVSDIRQCYASSQVCVAPMRLGSGLQNKILEAMAMEIPCVTTPLANEALGAVPDQHILLATTAKQIAQSIINLLNTPDLRSQLASQAKAFVCQHFSWDEPCRQLEQVFSQAIRHHQQL